MPDLTLCERQTKAGMLIFAWDCAQPATRLWCLCDCCLKVFQYIRLQSGVYLGSKFKKLLWDLLRNWTEIHNYLPCCFKNLNICIALTSIAFFFLFAVKFWRMLPCQVTVIGSAEWCHEVMANRLTLTGDDAGRGSCSLSWALSCYAPSEGMKQWVGWLLAGGDMILQLAVISAVHQICSLGLQTYNTLTRMFSLHR